MTAKRRERAFITRQRLTRYVTILMAVGPEPEVDCNERPPHPQSMLMAWHTWWASVHSTIARLDGVHSTAESTHRRARDFWDWQYNEGMSKWRSESGVRPSPPKQKRTRNKSS